MNNLSQVLDTELLQLALTLRGGIDESLATS